MNRQLLLFATALAIIVSPASQAQVVRTFVSAANGSDSNPCTRSQPCRSFGVAIASVDTGGEVVALDSGGYSPFSISKSVTVLSPEGVHAAVAPTAGTAILIGNVAARVAIRNLYLNSQGASLGIDVGAVTILYLEGMVVSGFTDTGIRVNPVTFIATIYLNDSTVRLNNRGLLVQGPVRTEISVDRSRFECNMTNGIFVGQRGFATVSNSIIAGNVQAGVVVSAESASTIASFSAHNCTISDNYHGIEVGLGSGTSRVSIGNSMISGNTNDGVQAQANGTAIISKNLITRHFRGLHNQGGTIESAGDNAIRGNIDDVIGVVTPFDPM